MEKTLVILKPDCVARHLVGRVLARFEEKGLVIAGMRMEMIARETAEKHYAEHNGKPFYPGLVNFITSGPVVVMALAGVEAVSVVRKMIGATSGRAAEPGSIRGDYGLSKGFNLVHASDSVESAERELALFFGDGKFMPEADQASLRWNYEFENGKAN
ncbi:MAG: nucleoside-diphosphate kinase [Planctomycetaceae bacterium]|nr:nucleoside-diphosphate kinase [Planctomycetaceae bacterium]